MELEKSRVSSQVRVFKTQTRNSTRKTRLFEFTYPKPDSKNPTFRVFLIGFLLNIMFNHVLNILRFEKINVYHLGYRLRSIFNNTFLHDDGYFY